MTKKTSKSKKVSPAGGGKKKPPKGKKKPAPPKGKPSTDIVDPFPGDPFELPTGKG